MKHINERKIQKIYHKNNYKNFRRFINYRYTNKLDEIDWYEDENNIVKIKFSNDDETYYFNKNETQSSLYAYNNTGYSFVGIFSKIGIREPYMDFLHYKINPNNIKTDHHKNWKITVMEYKITGRMFEIFIEDLLFPFDKAKVVELFKITESHNRCHIGHIDYGLVSLNFYDYPSLMIFINSNFKNNNIDYSITPERKNYNNFIKNFKESSACTKIQRMWRNYAYKPNGIMVKKIMESLKLTYFNKRHITNQCEIIT